ncbi:MAG: nucleotidyltransferase domain-containing protein, partial [Nanoarchaeota archaeon]
VQSILTELREINVLDYKAVGKNHPYFIKKNLVAKSFVLNAENYKLANIIRANPELEPIFQDIIKRSKAGLILLFGSYAKGSQKRESDIDIYIDTTSRKTKEDVRNVYGSISVKIGKFNPDDLLIKEIIKNHAIIKGGEEYYDKIRFFE